MTATSAASVRARVLLPGLLLSYTGGARTIELTVAGGDSGAGASPAVTLADALGALDLRYPGMRFRVVDEQGNIRAHIKMFVDGGLARDLAVPLPAHCEVMIVGALSGG